MANIFATFTCQECELKFFSQYDLTNHMNIKAHHKCSKCDARFTTDFYLMEHDCDEGVGRLQEVRRMRTRQNSGDRDVKDNDHVQREAFARYFRKDDGKESDLRRQIAERYFRSKARESKYI